MTDRIEGQARSPHQTARVRAALLLCAVLVLAVLVGIVLPSIDLSDSDYEPPSPEEAAASAYDGLEDLVSLPLSMVVDTLANRMHTLNEILEGVDDAPGARAVLEARVLGRDGDAAQPSLLLIAETDPSDIPGTLEEELDRLDASGWSDHLHRWADEAPSGPALDVVNRIVVLVNVGGLVAQDPANPAARAAVEAANAGDLGPGLVLDGS